MNKIIHDSFCFVYDFLIQCKQVTFDGDLNIFLLNGGTYIIINNEPVNANTDNGNDIKTPSMTDLYPSAMGNKLFIDNL